MNTSSVTTLEDAQPSATAAGPGADVRAIKHRVDESLSGKRKLLTIHSEKGEGGNDAVFLSLNEFPYLIPRGKPWNVPVEVVEVLKNAKTDTFEREGEAGQVVQRTTPRLNFLVEDAPDIVKEAPAAEATGKKK